MADQPSFIPSAWAANNSTTETIPATTSESGKASWDQGFPVETSLPLSEGGIPPKYGDFNGVLNVLSQFCLFAQAGGQFAWNATLDYSVGSIVLGTDGSIYRAAQVSGPSTTAVNPVGDTSGKWERIVSQSDINALEQEISDAMDAAEDAASNASAAQSAVTTLDANVVKLSGNQTVGGTKTFSDWMKAKGFYQSIASGSVTVAGGAGIGANDGAKLTLYGKNEATDPGEFKLLAGNATAYKILNGSPDGTLTWDGKNIITDGGDQTVGGVKTFSSNIVASTPYALRRNVDNSFLHIYGGAASGKGALLSLNGKDEASHGGYWTLRATTGNGNKDLYGSPDGTLKWDNKEFVYTSTDQTVGGVKTFSGEIHPTNAGTWCRVYNLNSTKGTYPVGNNVNYWMPFCDKNGNNFASIEVMLWIDGSVWTRLYVFENKATGGGNLYVEAGFDIASSSTMFRPSTNGITSLGSGGRRWGQIYSSNSTISTSDERLKQQVASIPDAVLDAWGDVDWRQFKFNSSVEEKGNAARIHTGLIAQHIDEVFRKRNLDASRYGLWCYDAWDATPEEVDDKGNVRNAEQPAGDMYSIRYEEALAMEAAYQRRRADRAEARISALEQRLDEMEAVLASLMSPVGDETYAEPEQEQDAEQEGEE